MFKFKKTNKDDQKKFNNNPNTSNKLNNGFEVNANHNRIPISKIENLNDWDKGFEAGFKYWEQGENERKKGNIDKAISLFDTARAKGYFAPALYRSYALAYRKLKDIENEYLILVERITRF